MRAVRPGCLQAIVLEDVILYMHVCVRVGPGRMHSMHAAPAAGSHRRVAECVDYLP